MSTAAAYRHCRAVTNREARNFSYGIRLLPPSKRAALSAIYAFSRRVDDVADGPLAEHEKMAALTQVRVWHRQHLRGSGLADRLVASPRVARGRDHRRAALRPGEGVHPAVSVRVAAAT